MRLLVTGAAAALLLALMASAQAQMLNQMPAAGQMAQRSHGMKDDKSSDTQKAKVNDKAYDAALRNLPDKQYDPWHGVR